MISFSLNEVDGNLDVKLEGDLDIDGTEVIEEQLIPTMEKYKAVNINFANVPFVDSTGVGLLLNVIQSLNEKGVKVTISNVRQEIFDIFELLEIPEIVGEGVFV
ncbi:STAS domain-containing protein [Bacillus methanolicus]|uniref:STAS domain-containing protein n=1 Tax=Bacillus methanolicus TaxID=1471 RepID=UPI00238032E1|nr:STAS domain-containing protein [Bacillus methanolicus]